MAVALEVVAEHRRARAQADLSEEASEAEARQKGQQTTTRPMKGRAPPKR